MVYGPHVLPFKFFYKVLVLMLYFKTLGLPLMWNTGIRTGLPTWVFKGGLILYVKGRFNSFYLFKLINYICNYM